MKTCSKCKVPKEESEFRFSAYDDRLEPRCRQCEKEYHRRYRLANLEARRAANRQRAQNHPGESATRSRAWRKQNPDAHREWKKRNPEKLSRGTLKRKYGITLEEYYRLLSQQNGACDMCGDEVKLKVDHNHKTGVVRGLLCQRCNTALGMLRDSPSLARKAAEYLEKHLT